MKHVQIRSQQMDTREINDKKHTAGKRHSLSKKKNQIIYVQRIEPQYHCEKIDKKNTSLEYRPYYINVKLRWVENDTRRKALEKLIM